jgi:hypothetical protein
VTIPQSTMTLPPPSNQGENYVDGDVKSDLQCRENIFNGGLLEGGDRHNRRWLQPSSG